MIKLEKLNGELMQLSFSGKKYHYTNSLLYNVHVNCAMIRLSMKIAWQARKEKFHSINNYLHLETYWW
jgi:hypothetical protein